MSYRPYYGLSGYEEVADTVYTLVLSQPAAQGEGGIWCVDRWMDQNGTRYLVVPETDQPMDDYYAALQDACDAGDRPDLLDPVAVALDFEEDWSGRDLSPDAFVLEGKRSLGALRPASGHGGVENGVGGYEARAAAARKSRRTPRMRACACLFLGADGAAKVTPV